MLANVGLLNSLVGLVLTFQIIIIPLNIFLLKNYFETIPKELEEAALIDGCSKIRAFWHIIVPISLPGFVIAAILSFRFSWNEFVLPIVLSNKPDVMVFQVALYQFISLYRIDWGFLTAGINIALIPIVVLMLIFQKRMIKGMTLGAVRG
jgi:ABC-type glycerol-3-phosphate transport system permease component